MKSKLFCCLLLWVASFMVSNRASAADSKVINPITDVCWKCIYPIHVMGYNIAPQHKDPVKYKKKMLCECPGTPPVVGIPVAFWEPMYLIDVTMTPYKLVGLGGAKIASAGSRKKGSISHVGLSGRSSFYNVHLYKYPILGWLNLLEDFPCLEKAKFNVEYMSEFDPLWDDDSWASVLSPDAFLYANPAAQAACIADCAASSTGNPLDKLFWCAGCSGSLFPLSGHVAHHSGGIQASSLAMHRLLAKLHRLGLMWGFGKDSYCDRKPMPKLDRTLYKTQLVFPVADTKGPCRFLGQSSEIWGSFKSYPNGGEDFVYLIWAKKHCCLDLAKPAAKAALKAMTGAP